MKVRSFFAALAALAAAVPVSAAEAQPRRAAQQDWTRTVVATPEGGYRMGNPNAEVRIVEYLSLTCPHCRQFAATGMPQLLPQVRSGRISIEYRNFVLNQLDLAAAMLSRCVAPANYFRFSDSILASQTAWMPRVQDMRDESATTPEAAMQHLGRVVTAAGLDRMGREDRLHRREIAVALLLVPEQHLGSGLAQPRCIGRSQSGRWRRHGRSCST